MRGIAYANLGEYDKAISDLTIAIIWDYNIYLAVLKGAISFHEDKHNFDKVVKIKYYAIHAVELPNHAFNFVRRGIIYSKMKEYEKAFMDFERAISLNKDMFVWRGNVNSLGCVGLGDKGRFNRVIYDYNGIIDKNPNDAFIYACRGFCHRYNYLENSIELAINEFNKAISLKPNYEFAYNGRGIAYLKKGEHLKAKEDFDKSRIFNGYDISCRVKLSRILEVPPYHIIKVKKNKESREEVKKYNENGKSESVINGSIKSNCSDYAVNKTIQKMEPVAIDIKSGHEKRLQRSADKTLKKMGLM